MATEAQITVQDIEGRVDVKIVAPVGELDESNLPQLEGTINPIAADESITTLILNFHDLQFLSSKVIGYLASTYSTFSRSSRQLAITDMNETVKDILALVGLDQMITVYPTLEEALTNL